MDGITLLERLLALQPNLAAIVLTAYGTIANAVEATKKGGLRLPDQAFRGEGSSVSTGKGP